MVVAEGSAPHVEEEGAAGRDNRAEEDSWVGVKGEKDVVGVACDDSPGEVAREDRDNIQVEEEGACAAAQKDHIQADADSVAEVMDLLSLHLLQSSPFSSLAIWKFGCRLPWHGRPQLGQMKT